VRNARHSGLSGFDDGIERFTGAQNPGWKTQVEHLLPLTRRQNDVLPKPLATSRTLELDPERVQGSSVDQGRGRQGFERTDVACDLAVHPGLDLFGAGPGGALEALLLARGDVDDPGRRDHGYGKQGRQYEEEQPTTMRSHGRNSGTSVFLNVLWPTARAS
jgi:hypothetical protein